MKEATKIYEVFPCADSRLRGCLFRWFNYDWCVEAYNESLKLLDARKYQSVYDKIDGLTMMRGKNFKAKDYKPKTYGFITWGFTQSRDDKCISANRYLHRFTYGKTMSLSRYLCYCFYVMEFYDYHGSGVLGNITHMMCYGTDRKEFTGEELVYISKDDVILLENDGTSVDACNSAKSKYESLMDAKKNTCYGIYVELCRVLGISYKRYDDIVEFNLNVKHLSSFKFFGKYHGSSFFSLNFGNVELRLPNSFSEDKEYYDACKKRLSSCCNDIRVHPHYKLFKNRFIGV